MRIKDFDQIKFVGSEKVKKCPYCYGTVVEHDTEVEICPNCAAILKGFFLMPGQGINEILSMIFEKYSIDILKDDRRWKGLVADCFFEHTKEVQLLRNISSYDIAESIIEVSRENDEFANNKKWLSIQNVLINNFVLSQEVVENFIHIMKQALNQEPKERKYYRQNQDYGNIYYNMGKRKELLGQYEDALLFYGISCSADNEEAEVALIRLVKEKKVSLFDVSTEYLKLSIRTFHCLRRAGITSLGDLSVNTAEETMLVSNLGRRSLEEVIAQMSLFGVSFRPSEEKFDYDRKLEELEQLFEKFKSEKEEMLSTNIEELELSVRSYNCLKRGGLYTLADIVNIKPAALFKIRNFGRRSADEIIEKLKKLQHKDNDYFKRIKEVRSVFEEYINLKTEYLDVDIEKLDWSGRIYRLMERDRVKTIGDIVRMQPEKFLGIRNLGRKSIEEIINTLKNIDELFPDILDSVEIADSNENVGVTLYNLFVHQYLNEWNAGNYEEAMGYLKTAIRFGYKIDYSSMAQAYLYGIDGLEKNLDKAYDWMKLYYESFEEDNNICPENKGDLIQFMYNFGICILTRLQYGEWDGDSRKQEMSLALSVWKKAVELANYEITEDNKVETADILALIGYCFLYGKIMLTDENVVVNINEEQEFGYTVLTKAEELGSPLAITVIANMYEAGVYVKQDDTVATNMYIRAAQIKEPNAIEWCQKRFINDLKWDNYDKWDEIYIMSLFNGIPEYYTKSCFIKANVRTLQEYKNSSLKEYDFHHVPYSYLIDMLLKIEDFVNSKKD